uniref:Uncharacterized protein n=2 Tax=Pan TaxID=9596 RepID=A0A2I3RU05_PANTR
MEPIVLQSVPHDHCNKVETELKLICGDVLDALDKHLIPAATTGKGTTTGIWQNLPQEMTGRRWQRTAWWFTKLLVILQ